jgi:hypothetical protein
MLVATVDSSPIARRTRVPRALAAVAAFLLALVGGGAAGAITATAIDAPTGTISEQQLDDGSTYIFSADSLVYGEPIEVSGSGDLSVDVGERPRSANLLAVVFKCVDPGDYVLVADDEHPSTITCRADALGGDGTYLAVLPNNYMPRAEGGHEVVVTSENGGRFDLWIAWIQRVEPEIPDASAEQVRAISDGIVTEDEYRAAFERYRACMSDAGVELHMLPEQDGRIDFGIPESGLATSDICYELEFFEVDLEWQTRKDPATEEIREYWRTCVEELGLEPAPTSHRMMLRIRDAGIDLQRCREFGSVPTP